jgi:hypothetical protein
VMRGGYAPRTSPYPPGLSWRCFKRRNDAGFSRIPSRLAHRARPIRQYQADATLSRLLPPSPATPGSGCLQLHPAAATAGRWMVSHLHPEHVRSTRGALPVLPPVGFPESPPAPAVHLSAQRALPKPRRVWGYLMLCSATVPRSLFPGSSSAWR